ncbi:hypothetical protein KP79_PYT16083 [Mizuhopecten yessoensis]|uniref:Uncharacterized protein n=1 Tax=Mizuhopecten yessoensis TaxID=6573 RepID=A0A210Q3Q3_MIZYE|nr:hypothetical protein KP79_PYT16083 [Mizuhopecten yessoensis]
MKGDITYIEWRFEIRSLDRDPDISPSLLIQAIRHSLRGSARRMLITLGVGSSVAQILTKLDSLFGDTSTQTRSRDLMSVQSTLAVAWKHYCKPPMIMGLYIDHLKMTSSSTNFGPLFIQIG